MKILFITQLLPYPPRNGGAIKVYAILKLLAKMRAKIHLVTFHDDEKKAINARTIEKKLNIRVTSLYNPQTTAPNRELKHVALRSLFSIKPFRVFKYHSEKMAALVGELSTAEKYDVIYLEQNTSFQYLEHCHTQSNTKVIYDEQNIDSVAMFRNALEKQQTPLIRAFSLLDAYKNYLYEKKIVRSVDGIFSISDHDRLLLLQRGASSDTTRTLPVPMIPKKIYRFPKQPTIIIVGLLSWAPNKFGILWFYDQVYPIIKSRLPGTTLLLVGLRPGKELLNLARDPSVIVTGEVPSITPYYQQASVLVAPILAGGGIRIKILHALAAGVPVVSTKMGAEGIKAINGKHFFIANTEKKLAAQIIKVLTDKKVAQTLSFNGLQFIGKYYNEKKAEKILAQMLDVKAD